MQIFRYFFIMKQPSEPIAGSSFVIGEQTLFDGRFLALHLIQYQDQDGIKRSWESAVRVASTPAVMILPIIKPDTDVVVIRQFRPPTGKYIWETPAGLIDPGEDAGAAALRELAEETGFSGKLQKVLPPSFSSSGLSGESVYLAFVEIDGNEYPPDRVLQTDFDESENIAAFRVKAAELNKFLLSAIERGDGVDSKLLLISEFYAGDFPGNR